MTLYFYYTITEPGLLQTVGKINYAFAEIMIFMILALAYVFPRKLRDLSLSQKMTAFAVLVAVVLLTVATDQVVAQESIIGISRETRYGPLFPVFLLYFLTTAAISIWVLVD
ncbi:MAG: hypothetical protein ACK2UH_08600, partial [Candidatus Promineifilaceae bacterium]